MAIGWFPALGAGSEASITSEASAGALDELGVGINSVALGFNEAELGLTEATMGAEAGVEVAAGGRMGTAVLEMAVGRMAAVG